MPDDNDEIIRDHYKRVADQYGDSPQSTMEDSVTRQKESDLIMDFLAHLCQNGNTQLSVLDLGCGNGHTLRLARESHADVKLTGLDFSSDLLQLARDRALPDCTLLEGDARSLPFEDESFDAVYTQRCLINILDWGGQQEALQQVHRVLKPRGCYLMIESFTDGLAANNKARAEADLEPLNEAVHNRYFDKSRLHEYVNGKFEIVNADGGEFSQLPSNFLSSHYFMARVVHPVYSKGGNVKNSEFVKFFSGLPAMGNYSAVQAHILRKI